MAETVNAGTIRNRTIRVGKRLEEHRDEIVPPPADTTPAVKEVVVGLDGGYVKSCHRRPERNFEVIVGKVIDPNDASTRFAFVRGTGTKDEGGRCVGEALRARGADAKTAVTVLTDGDACLREVQKAVVPGATHILDWFHLSMRFQNMSQKVKGPLEPGGNVVAQRHALDELERAKWTGQRYRSGQRISTSFAESSVNEIISHRMSKQQQMRWNRHTAPEFLRVRIHILNDTMEQAFRRMHTGFRPELNPQPAASVTR